MGKLNKEQEEAANFLNGICTVIAVPGSGKTRTMMERIGKLVIIHKVAPENILGLTFTRNTAEEMRHRLTSVLGDLSSRVMLSTIHGFCYYLLKREGVTFDILSGKDKIIFLRKIMKKLTIKDLSIGMVLREISLAKNNLISVDELKEMYEGDKSMLKIAELYEKYDAAKAKHMLLDFDDLLVETWKLLSNSEDVRQKYNETYKHLLVDEFQDTNPLQVEIFKILINESKESSFWTCGDDWQSIYAFTGASVGNILNFKETFPDSKEFILNMNYRSTPQILKGCQNLIKHNLKKIDKTLKTKNKDGEDIIVLDCASEEDEALRIANEIFDLIKRREFEFKDIVVLYRANFQSRIIEEVFSQQKVPYHIEKGLNFYHRHEIKVLLDYMRLISKPDSEEGDEALCNILNVPNRYIGRKFTGELEQFSMERDIHLYAGLKKMKIDLPYIKKNVKEFIGFLNPLMKDAERFEPSELIALLRASLDYDRHIAEDDVPSPDDEKIQNLNQLQMAATKYTDIEKFLDYTDTFQEDAANDKDGVSLMTIHKSKGLEFKTVFLIGMVESIMPTKNGDIEEERRICFVAISRAMNLLYLSHPQTYLGQPSKRSIFLDEIMESDE